MNVEVYTVGELPGLLELDRFKNSEHIPIYPLRANSYFKNPSAEKTDKVLWCLFDENEMLAYRLVLPDLLKTSKENLKISWLSCVWVNPKHRGKGYGKDLTALALKEWDHKCLSTNSAAASFNMYVSMKLFSSLKIKDGIRLYYRFSTAELLEKRNKIFAAAKPILKIGDSFFNALKPNRKKHDLQSKNLNVQILKKLDKESFSFLNNFTPNEFGARTEKTFDWIINSPWIKQIDPMDDLAKRYHFSANAKRFDQAWHKVKINHKVKVLLMTSIVNNDLKIPYLYVEENNAELALKYIENFCLENKINTLTIFHPQVVEQINANGSKAIYKKAFEKKIMAWNGISKDLCDEHTTFQDGIGDGVFT